MSRPIYRCARLARLVWLVAFAALPGFSQSTDAAVTQQIADIVAAKSSFTAAEKKLSSGLAFASRLQSGSLPSSLVSAIHSPAGPDGMVRVDIRGSITPALVNQIGSLGGQVTGSFPQFKFLQANVPLASVAAIAGNRDVASIREADRMKVNRVARPAGHNGLAFFIGSLTSQGYISHQAQQVVTNYGYTGSGVKVGVLSDSASPARVAALIASGDLPADTVVLPGQDGGAATDEGTAMMEIVSDMAPRAQLYFATADPSQGQMAANILALQAAGCSIIVDDVTYFAEGVFQDGIIAQAVNSVVANGAIYFSSAANSGSLDKGTSGTWEGDFVDGGEITSGPLFDGGETGNFHNFGTVGSPQNYDVLTAGTSFISLKWSDPLGGSTNDYDLFLLNAAGTALMAFSAGAQSGTQDPYELMFCVSNNALCTFPTNSRIVVVKYSGDARALHLDTLGGRVSIKTSGATYGHNAAGSAITAAATYWNSARTGTRPFTGFANTIETFSSDGPRRIFYNPNGTAISGSVLFGGNGGTSLQKPDLTAADGTTARTPGFNPFFGTSAAAPHLAGIAALVKSARPSLTNAQIKQVMIGTALDNMAVGWDRDGGFGIAMALAAVQAALALP